MKNKLKERKDNKLYFDMENTDLVKQLLAMPVGRGHFIQAEIVEHHELMNLANPTEFTELGNPMYFNAIRHFRITAGIRGLSPIKGLTFKTYDRVLVNFVTAGNYVGVIHLNRFNYNKLHEIGEKDFNVVTDLLYDFEFIKIRSFDQQIEPTST